MYTNVNDLMDEEERGDREAMEMREGLQRSRAGKRRREEEEEEEEDSLVSRSLISYPHSAWGKEGRVRSKRLVLSACHLRGSRSGMLEVVCALRRSFAVAKPRGRWLGEKRGDCAWNR